MEATQAETLKDKTLQTQMGRQSALIGEELREAEDLESDPADDN